MVRRTVYQAHSRQNSSPFPIPHSPFPIPHSPFPVLVTSLGKAPLVVKNNDVTNGTRRLVFRARLWAVRE